MGASASSAPIHQARPWVPAGAAASADAALQQLPGMRQGGKGWSVDEFLARAPAAPSSTGPPPEFSEFERIYSGAQAAPAGIETPFAQDHESAVAPCFKAFMDSGKAAQPFPPMRLPSNMALSLPDQIRIRDRSLIMARQMFADQGGQFADAQVGALLSSLNIDPTSLPPSLGQASWDSIYSKAAPGLASEYAANQAMAANQDGGQQWVTDFEKLGLAPGMHQQQPGAAPSNWVSEFDNTSSSGWAQEFANGATSQHLTKDDESAAITDWVDDFQSAGVQGRTAENGAASSREQSRRLAETLAANQDPKFQNSQFLKFMSKMSRGEVIIDGNQVVNNGGGEGWANEFAAPNWADEFTTSSKPSPWGEEFASFQAAAAHEGDWATQFADGVANEWAQEFHGSSTDGWQEEFATELEKLAAAGPGTAHGGYIMAENNPFLNDMDSLVKGRDLFRKVLL